MKRVLRVAIVVMVVSGVAVAITPRPLQDGIGDALCAAYPKDSPEWILFGCFLHEVE